METYRRIEVDSVDIKTREVQNKMGRWRGGWMLRETGKEIERGKNREGEVFRMQKDSQKDEHV